MFESILHPVRLQELARQWLLEDTSNFDLGGSATGDSICEFIIFMKSQGRLAGIPFANMIFEELGLNAKWFHKDGDWLNPITEVASISGPAQKLLLAERVVLNIMSRASGVATITSRMLSQLHHVQWNGILAGTRKTTPGFRMVEKYALLVGGADMHRYDLSGMVMLKDNHVSICGSVKEAVKKVRKVCGFTQKIEVECRSLQDALDSCEAGCDVVMLDNFNTENLRATAEEVKIRFPNILIESSGGVTMENIVSHAISCVDIISSSVLVQGYPAVDFSMKVKC